MKATFCTDIEALRIAKSMIAIRSPQTSLSPDVLDIMISKSFYEQEIDSVLAETIDVIPQTLFPEKTKPIVIWDLSLWRLYELFLRGRRIIYDSTGKDADVLSKLDSDLMPLVCAPFGYHLALQCQDPCLAKAFALAFSQIDYENPNLSKLIKYDIRQRSHIAKIYIAEHESVHIAYNRDPQSYEHLSEYVKNQLTWISDYLFENHDYQFDPYRNIDEYIDVLRNDTEFLEDMSCDLIAHKRTWEYVKQSPLTRIEDLKSGLAFMHCEDIINDISWFIQMLTQVTVFWQKQSINYFIPVNSKTTYDEGHCIRQDILPFLVAHELEAWQIGDISSYVNNIDTIDLDYDIGQKIGQLFLTKESYQFWAEVAKTSKDIGCSIKELLGWIPTQAN